MTLNVQPTTTCPHCHRDNLPGELVCRHCQHPLSVRVGTRTRGLELDTNTAELVAPSGTHYLAPDEPIALKIEGSPAPLWLEPRRQVVLGRVHPQNPNRPDIDLSLFQALELGVSTRHVALFRHQTCELMLEDLISRNGTFLNGERLRPHIRYRVHSGDHVRLGKLCFQIVFGG